LKSRKEGTKKIRRTGGNGVGVNRNRLTKKGGAVEKVGEQLRGNKEMQQQGEREKEDPMQMRIIFLEGNAK